MGRADAYLPLMLGPSPSVYVGVYVSFFLVAHVWGRLTGVGGLRGHGFFRHAGWGRNVALGFAAGLVFRRSPIWRSGRWGASASRASSPPGPWPRCWRWRHSGCSSPPPRTTSSCGGGIVRLTELSQPEWFHWLGVGATALMLAAAVLLVRWAAKVEPVSPASETPEADAAPAVSPSA